MRPLGSLLYDDSSSSFQPLFEARDNSTSMTPAAGANRKFSVNVPLAIDAGGGDQGALNPAADNDALRLGYGSH